MANILRESAQRARESRALSADFVRIELELATTFCEMALRSANQDKIRRNLDHAKRAYQAAMRFGNRLPISGKSFQNRRKAGQVRKLLAEVEERVRS